MEHLLNTENLLALLTLTSMEIVLGVDNIIFIAILVAKVPAHQQTLTRQLGITLALVMRLGLLFSISWVMHLTDPLVTVASRAFSGRDLILLGGGLFLVGKATFEIHDKLEAGGTHGIEKSPARKSAFLKTLIQIMVLDIVFSLDSVITAVGMADHLSIMVVAMVIAVGVMLLASGAISRFVDRHPTIKILALAFLILIGVMLAVEGMGGHIGKGYIYSAMAFAFVVELLNIRFRKVHRH